MASKKFSVPRSIGRSLNFTTGRLNALCQKILDPHDLSLPQWVILSCLWREGELTVGELSELAGTGLPATSRIVERMVDRGLVMRRQHGSDRRVTVVQSTYDGNRLKHLSDFHDRINELVLKELTEEERVLAFELLEKMQRNAETALLEQ